MHKKCNLYGILLIGVWQTFVWQTFCMAHFLFVVGCGTGVSLAGRARDNIRRQVFCQTEFANPKLNSLPAHFLQKADLPNVALEVLLDIVYTTTPKSGTEPWRRRRGKVRTAQPKAPQRRLKTMQQMANLRIRGGEHEFNNCTTCKLGSIACAFLRA